VYTISKEFAFEAAHQLSGLPEGHQCARLHGHSYRVILELACQDYELADPGFVVDYGDLNAFKDFIDRHLDHRNLNDACSMPTTAENLALWLYGIARGMWPQVVAVRVSETQKTWATYSPESEIDIDALVASAVTRYSVDVG
jgi:6-pyruvoyltetrahydropterin/6-carboxytetrahydropterin synthase